MERAVSPDDISQMADGICERLATIIVGELAKRDSGMAISRIAIARVKQRIVLPGFMNNALVALEEPVANVINQTIGEYAPSLLNREIGDMETRILDMRLCDIVEKSSVGVDRTLDMLTQIGVALCQEQMEEWLQSADIGKVIACGVEIVTDKQLDSLWKKIVTEEQKLLIMLGGIIGFAVSGMVLTGMMI